MAVGTERVRVMYGGKEREREGGLKRDGRRESKMEMEQIRRERERNKKCREGMNVCV